MKKNCLRIFSAIILALGLAFGPMFNVFAEDEVAESEAEQATVVSGTSISLMPTSKILQIASDSVYDQSFTVNNDGDAEIRIEVYAAPYSYVYSNEEDLYKLGFSNENNFTQISRWITFLNTNGEYVEKANFAIEPKGSLEVNFRITTPSGIPSGGQYAVIFAHTLSNALSGSGIRTEASPGMVVYGRSIEGEVVVDAEITELDIVQKNIDGKNSIVASAKVKNAGNIDFSAVSSLKIDPIIGFSSYETPVTAGRTSIIPEAELVVSDAWTEAPSFGIFKATFSVTVDEETETVERIIFRISPLFIIIAIILLTIIIISVIMVVRKRRERRSRLAI